MMPDRVYEHCGQHRGATARILFTVPRVMARVTGVVFVDAKATCGDRQRVLRDQRSRVNIALVVAGKVGGEWRFRVVCTDLHQQCAPCLGEVLGGVTQPFSGGRAC